MPFGRKKSLMDRAHDYVDQLSDQLTETVIPQLESAWEQAVDKAGPAIADAREKATPLIEEGRTRAAEADDVPAGPPAKGASKAEWLAYARTRAQDSDEAAAVEGFTKEQLIEQYGGS